MDDRTLTTRTEAAAADDVSASRDATFVLGVDETGAKVTLSSATLRRHAVFLGSSGSGKTVACKVLCEEAALAGIPVIAIDPQGDIASLKLDADPEDVAAHGGDAARVALLRERAEVRIFTPGSGAGLAIGANPLALPATFRSEEDRVRSISVVSGTIARLLGRDTDDAEGRAVAAFVYTRLDEALRSSRPPRTLADLADGIERAGEGGGAAALLTVRQRGAVAKGLRVLSIGASKLLFGGERPLDVAALLGKKAPRRKTRISVIHLNSLGSQEEKDVFVSVLASSLYAWMLAHPSERLQALLYIDEIAPFLPPVRKPAAKESLRLLFKQARKFGIGCLVATQNPGDIDYTALAQFGTWGIGRLSTRQDIRKIAGVVKSLDPSGAERVLDSLPTLPPGRFVLLSPDELREPRFFTSRWLLTRHRTLEEGTIRELTSASERTAESAAPETVAEPAAPAVAVPPVAGPAEVAATPLEERLASLLREARAALRLRDVISRLGASRPKAAAAIRALLGDERLVKMRCRGTTWLWDPRFHFFPQLGLVEPVAVAETRVLEPFARARARDASSRRLLFLREEEVASMRFHHLPLSRVELPGGGEVLLNGLSGKFVTIDGERGFAFHDSLEGRLDLVRRESLGARVPLRSVTPGEIDLDHDALRRLIPLEEARRAVERSVGPSSAGRASRVFIPLWEAELRHKKTGRSRVLWIDGIFGRAL